MPGPRIHNPTVIPPPSNRHSRPPLPSFRPLPTVIPAPPNRHSGPSQPSFRRKPESGRTRQTPFYARSTHPQPNRHTAPLTVIPGLSNRHSGASRNPAAPDRPRLSPAQRRPYQSFSLITENTAPSLSRSTANRAKSAMSIGPTTTPPPSSCALATVASKSATPK